MKKINRTTNFNFLLFIMIFNLINSVGILNAQSNCNFTEILKEQIKTQNNLKI